MATTYTRQHDFTTDRDATPPIPIRADRVDAELDAVKTSIDTIVGAGGTTTAMLADLAVTTAKIADSAVTSAKIADSAVTAAKFADGAVSTAKLADNAVTTAKITDANVTTAKIADANVTTAKLEDSSVTTAKIADVNVTTAKIADANVTTGKIADDAVTTAKITNANVTTAKIADSNVTTAKIADDAVTTAKVLNSNVTTAKIADANITTAKIADSGVTTAKVADANITSGKLADGAVAEAKIADTAVTAGKIASNAVTTAKINDANVTTAKIADDAITTDKVADNAITNAKLPSGMALDATKIADGSVTNTEFQYLDGTTSNLQGQFDSLVDPGFSVDETNTNTAKNKFVSNNLAKGWQDTKTAFDAGTQAVPLTMDHESTPSAPASGKNKLYFKDDGKLYKIDSGGSEAQVGGDSDAVVTNTSDIFTTNVRLIEQHGTSAYLMERGFTDELVTSNDMIDESASTGYTYNATDDYYQNTAGSTGQTVDHNYDDESESLQLEYTKTNLGAGNLTVADGPYIVTAVGDAKIKTSDSTANTYTVAIDTSIPAGVTVTESAHQGSDDVTKLFDGNNSSRWEVNYGGTSSPAWCKIDFGSGNEKTIGKIEMYKASDQGPRDYTLAGSNDDSSYTTLLTIVDEGYGGWSNNTFSNSTAYRYYKLEITDDAGSSGSQTNFQELNLYNVIAGSAVSPQFGTAMMSVGTGGDNYISVPDSDDWNCDGNFAIDFWMNHRTLVGSGNIILQHEDSSNYNHFSLSGTTDVEWKVRTGGANHWAQASSSLGLSVGTWYHVALVRSGSNIYGYVAGNQVFTSAVSNGDPANIAGILKIGGDISDAAAGEMDGWIDEFRWSNSDRGWTGSTITVPDSVHTNDANTKLLLHMDGSDDSTTFTDSSTSNTSNKLVSIASGTLPDDIANGRIYISAAWYDITSRDSATELTLASHPANGTYTDWQIRLSEFAGGVVKLNDRGGNNPITKPAVISPTFSNLHSSTAWSAITDITPSETVNSQIARYLPVMTSDSTQTDYPDTDTDVSVFLKAQTLTTDIPYATDTESSYLQQEWTTAIVGSSNATFTNSSATVTISSGTWPDNCDNGRITQDGTNWYDVSSRDSDQQLTLTSNFSQSTVTGTYTIRMTEFSGDKVQLNTAYGAESINQQQTTVNEESSKLDTTSRTHVAQSFTPSVTGKVTKIQIHLWVGSSSTPTDHLKLSIQAGSSNPDGTALSNVVTINANSLTTSAAEYTYTFSTEPNLTSGTTYWIVLERDTPASDGGYKLNRNTDGTAYSGGRLRYKESGTWEDVAGDDDCTFKVYMSEGENVITEPVTTVPTFATLKDSSAWGAMNSVAITDTPYDGSHTITANGNAVIKTSGGGVSDTYLNGTSSWSFDHNYNFGEGNTTNGNGYNEVGHTFYSGTNISHVGRVKWPIHKNGSPDSTKIRCRVWSLTGSGTSKTPDSLLGTSGEIESDVSATSEGSPNNREFDFPEPVALTANTWYGISIRFDYDHSSSGSNHFRISVNSDSTGKSNIENGSGSDMNQFADTNSNTGSGSDETWTTGHYSDKPMKSQIYDGYVVTPKFGQMAKFDGTGDYLSIPESAGFTFGSGNFTVEAWVNLANHLGQDMGIIQLRREESAWNWALYYHDSGVFKWEMIPDGSSSATTLTSTTSLANGTWYHLAIVRNSDTVTMYLNGSSEASTTWANTMRQDSGDELLCIGQKAGNVWHNGWMDEVRISKGVARYTGNFTPSESAFTTDSDTSLLLHMDGSDDSTTFVDSSYDTYHYYTFIHMPTGVSAYNDTNVKVVIWTGSYWKEAVRFYSSAWQRNTDTADSTATTWTNATVNDMVHAISEAIENNTRLRMKEADVEGIDPNREAAGGWSTSVGKVGMVVTMKSASTSGNATTDLVQFNYDTEAIWKNLVKFDTTWKYNSDTNRTNAETWVSISGVTDASNQGMLHAISEGYVANSAIFGELTGTLLGDITQAQWATQFTSGTTKKVGIITLLKSASTSQNPQVDYVRTTNNSQNAAITLITKQWDGSTGRPSAPASAPAKVYLFVIDEQTTGTPTYKLAIDGTNYGSALTFDASWAFGGMTGSGTGKTVRRAAVDVSGYQTGTNPKVKIEAALGADYKLHAVGLQTRSG